MDTNEWSAETIRNITPEEFEQWIQAQSESERFVNLVTGLFIALRDAQKEIERLKNTTTTKVNGW